MPLKKCSMIKAGGVLLTLLYSVFVFYTLKTGLSPTRLIPVFCMVLAIQFLGHGRRLLLGAGVALLLLFSVSRDPLFLLFYPVAVNALFAWAFFSSLRGTPLIQTFAEKMGYRLDDKGRAYTRKATVAWGCFNLANGTAALITVFLPMAVWALYNGLIANILIGCMFLGEYLVRRKAVYGH